MTALNGSICGSMASIHKHRSRQGEKTSPNWYAKFLDENGRTKFISTKKTDRKEALEVALGWQRAARLAREGTLTEMRSRQIIGEILERTTGHNLYDDTIEGFLTRWLKGKETANAKGTAVRYKHTVELFIESLGNKKSLSISCVTPEHIEEFRDAQLALGKASSSVNVDLKTLRNAFNLAKKRGIISVNPVDVVDLPEEQRNVRGVFSIDQIAGLLQVASNEWKMAIMLGYYIGARLGDAVRIKWENIDLERGVIRYLQQKTKKQIECPLHPDLQRHLCAISATRGDSKGLLTPTLVGKGVGGRNGLSREFKMIMVKAGINEGRIEQSEKKGKGRAFSTLSFHALRHTSVSAMANVGVSAELRMKISGHTSESSHRTYTHLELETLRNAVSKLPSATALPNSSDAKTEGRNVAP